MALRESRGEIIGFAADDDLLFPDHLELLLKELEEGATLAYSQALWVSTDGIAAPFLTNLTLPDELNTFMTRGNSIAASCFLYRTNSLKERDPWPEDVPVAADWHLWRRIVAENPERPVSYCRLPTVLHFSAKRKQSRHSLASRLATMLEIADNVDWWPTPLRVPIPDGVAEQETYANLMRQDPFGWSERVRSASNDLVMRLAWDDISTVRPTLATQAVRIATLQSEVVSLRKRLGASESSLLEANGWLNTATSERERLSKALDEAATKIKALTNELDKMRSSKMLRIREALFATFTKEP